MRILRTQVGAKGGEAEEVPCVLLEELEWQRR